MQHEQTHKYVKNCAIHDESLPSKRTFGFLTNARAIAIRSGIGGGGCIKVTRGEYHAEITHWYTEHTVNLRFCPPDN